MAITNVGVEKMLRELKAEHKLLTQGEFVAAPKKRGRPRKAQLPVALAANIVDPEVTMLA